MEFLLHRNWYQNTTNDIKIRHTHKKTTTIERFKPLAYFENASFIMDRTLIDTSEHASYVYDTRTGFCIERRKIFYTLYNLQRLSFIQCNWFFVMVQIVYKIGIASIVIANKFDGRFSWVRCFWQHTHTQFKWEKVNWLTKNREWNAHWSWTEAYKMHFEYVCNLICSFLHRHTWYGTYF